MLVNILFSLQCSYIFQLGHRNEEILSDASDVEGKEKDENLDYIGSDGEQMGDSEEETAEEKRLRLAKKYLEEIERQGINLLDVSLYYYNQKIRKIPN